MLTHPNPAQKFYLEVLQGISDTIITIPQAGCPKIGINNIRKYQELPESFKRNS